ncbi:Transcription factor ABORTED MICROSPORES [Morella rubra]|uniref:Transcription factor ABORTED MICROSPORES n=1 Tax=Morella rubra TaxID=262757 RepID=A0A6A1UKH6_9ROSI|nr:Transcription factor ABORTED MICROSPORES [Morella rubra]
MEETMKGLEGAREWLRPLVQTKAWDYCVVWKLGDDPSRFIEWMGCCCMVGGSGVRDVIKKFVKFRAWNDVNCRDRHINEDGSTKRVMWKVAIDSIGTQVLIPVAGGLIELFAAKHQQTGSVSNCDKAAENDKAKVIPKPQGEQYHSKNLVTERKRRRRIKDGLYTLRSLVPRITKMDMSSILGDAIGYIQELQKEGEQLQDQLTKMEEEDCKKNKAESKISTSDSIHGDSISLLLPEQNQGPSGCGEKKQTEVQVEVNQISQRDFWIRFCCEQRRGGFTRLMEALNLLGLQVADANITTFRGKVLNILKVEAKKDIQLTNLRSSLIELAN